MAENGSLGLRICDALTSTRKYDSLEMHGSALLPGGKGEEVENAGVQDKEDLEETIVLLTVD